MISFLLRCSHPTPHFPSLALLTWITFYNRVFPSQPTLPFTCSAHSGHLWSPSASGVPIPPHTSLHLLCSLRSPLISSGVPIPTHISLHLLCSLGSPLISLGVHIPPHTSLHLLCSLGSPFIISVPIPPYASLHLLCSLGSPLISFLLRCSHPTPHFPSPALLSAPIPPHTSHHLLCSLGSPLISFLLGCSHPTPHASLHLLCSLGSPLISLLLRCSHPTCPVVQERQLAERGQPGHGDRSQVHHASHSRGAARRHRRLWADAVKWGWRGQSAHQNYRHGWVGARSWCCLCCCVEWVSVQSSVVVAVVICYLWMFCHFAPSCQVLLNSIWMKTWVADMNDKETCTWWSCIKDFTV